MHVLTPKPTRLHHDFETYCDLNLKKVGLARYAQHPSASILMCAYALDDRDVQQWVPEEGELMPAELEDALLDPDIKKYAWNAQFERWIWKHVWGLEIPLPQWRDPMVMALYCSFPGQLAKAGPVTGVPEELLKKDGHRLINWFSVLRPATKTKPIRRVRWYEKLALWEEYKNYNIHDVLAERNIYKRVRKYDLPQEQWDLWCLDQEINERGIPINRAMAENIIAVRDQIVSEKLLEMKRLTGLDNPNSNTQLLPWLNREGYVFEDMKAAHITRALEMLSDDVTSDCVHPSEIEKLYRVLELRAEVSKTSTKKFDAIIAQLDDDDLLKNCFAFMSAQRTHRWGGRVIQPQNLAKPVPALSGLVLEASKEGNTWVVGGMQLQAADLLEHLDKEAIELVFGKPMDAMSGAVRTVIQAPDGYVFLDGDYAAIENVVLGWMADDEKILRVFRDGLDPYIDFATDLYKESYAELWSAYKAGDKSKRTVAKPGVLGCGYMLGAGHQFENKHTGEIEATGLLGYAWNMGVRLTPEEAKLSVDTWRAKFETTRKFWYKLQDAAFKCVRTREETWQGKIGFDIKGPFLRMILPDRCLHYYKPRISMEPTPWGEKRPTLTYMNENEKKQWVRTTTHPGKITENGDQAIARGLLAHGMRNVNEAGIPIVMHVHDQIVGLVKEDEADEKLKLMVDRMEDLPDYAKTMPVRAAAHVSRYFVKD